MNKLLKKALDSIDHIYQSFFEGLTLISIQAYVFCVCFNFIYNRKFKYLLIDAQNLSIFSISYVIYSQFDSLMEISPHLIRVTKEKLIRIFVKLRVNLISVAGSIISYSQLFITNFKLMNLDQNSNVHFQIF